MELTGEHGERVVVNAAEQSDADVQTALQELGEVAAARGLLVPALAGTMAVEGASASVADSEQVEEDPYADIRAAIKAQETIAYGVYHIMGRNPQDRIADSRLGHMRRAEFTEELEAWLTDDKLAYVRAQQEADPETRFILVATPNVLVSAKQIEELVGGFAVHSTYRSTIVPLLGKYSSEELSGTNPSNGNRVQFSLMPTRPLMNGWSDNSTELQQLLASLRAQYPGAKLKVPSVLEAIAYWHTLRPAGLALNSDTYPDKNIQKLTAVRHFDLEPREGLEGSGQHLSSSVDSVGIAHLEDEYRHGVSPARIAVG